MRAVIVCDWRWGNSLGPSSVFRCQPSLGTMSPLPPWPFLHELSTWSPMDGLREGHRHATVRTHETRMWVLLIRRKFYKPLVGSPRPCITDTTTKLTQLLAKTTAIEHNCQFFRSYPNAHICQHGLNLWKHAVEVSIDYCASCMNGWERHNLSTCCFFFGSCG